ncbi:hypothetical protein LLEC1_05763 [Akanthomyces lecanii]|uniref:Zn(2)-C6 fungal-type domain-containing protein n=1 Tax=Cordyceps confragosa TaxID=2714763 RepID=A0A179IU75_CORDF|nr:hypothetical protein LLEC1_05763 [Akanthomyces lecanii]
MVLGAETCPLTQPGIQVTPPGPSKVQEWLHEMQTAEEKGRQFTPPACDERQPKCSRCLKQGINCEYATTADGADEAATNSVSERHATRNSDSEKRDSVSAEPSSTHTPADSRHSMRGHDAEDSAMMAAAGRRPVKTLPMLDARELELFSHYITHTSRVIPYGKEDLFPLQVGMPNLAFTNPAVMSSILALAASCKCHDMIGSSPTSHETLEEICTLLRLADRHHHASLGQLQNDLKERQFQSVLPNAALMVLYALSCHYVRVLLAKRARQLGTMVPKDALPFQSQWITSIRAAHVAFVGLLQPGLRPSRKNASPGSNPREDGAELLTSPPSPTEAGSTYGLQDGPAEETRRLLLPIISNTYKAALARLTARNASLELNLDQRDAKLEACGAALRLLEELFQTMMEDVVSQKEPSTPHDFGALDNVAPWLVQYLARVTSATPSKLWRRRIMAFLNQVPYDFLHLVQLALDCMPVEDSQVPLRSADEPLPLEAAHKPAMDIFAHWLVLVMLLDGVWWIGDVGHWELGRIIRFIATQGFVLDLVEGETWWPETMHAIKSTLGGAASMKATGQKGQYPELSSVQP